MKTITSNIRRQKDGMALFAVMATLAALAFVSATVFTVVATDVKIAASLKYGQQAFYNADAAVASLRDQIEDSLSSGSLQLTNSNETVNFTSPSGFSFDTVTNLVRLNSTTMDAYWFRATGHNQDSAITIEATFKRKPALTFGVFGNALVDMKANGSVYSYNSSILSSPSPSDSTGDADTGSNEDMITHVGTYVDGDLVLGQDTYGTQGVWADPGTGSTVTGEHGLQIDHVDQDPLGAIGGDLAAEFTAASVSNNNASAVPAIPSSRKIALSTGSSMTLSAGIYYVSEITLNNSATLNINATSGPVKIYLTGELDAKNGSSINLVGDPPDFTIYSNSSDPITLFNSSLFKGTIYAPYASVEVKNSADFYGLVWADEVDIKNSGDVYIDLSIVKENPSDEITLLSWKEVYE